MDNNRLWPDVRPVGMGSRVVLTSKQGLELTSQAIQPNAQMSLARAHCSPFRASGGAQRKEKVGPVNVSVLLDAVSLNRGCWLFVEKTGRAEATERDAGLALFS